MRTPIKENPVTTLFMAGFGIFIMVGYLLVVKPVKTEQYQAVKDMCGETITYVNENMPQAAVTNKQ